MSGRNLWYLIKNIVLLILITALSQLVGGLATVLVEVVAYIFGVCLIFQAIMSFSETDIKTSLIGIGLGVLCIVGAGTLSEYEVFIVVASFLASAFIAYIGLKQFFQRDDNVRRTKGTSFSIPVKIMTIIYPICIMLNGVLAIIFLISKFVTDGGLTILSTISGVVGIIGPILWLANAVFVAIGATQNGIEIGGPFRRKNSGSSSAVKSASSGPVAKEADVRRKMESVANYFNGGFDYSGNAKVSYNVSVRVENGNINFTLKISQSGNFTDVDVRILKEKIQKRGQLIHDRAVNEINRLNIDRSYSLSVNVA